ncbi:MAG: UDP-N-acetylmuramate dehydrogenase [Flavobacteriaceae bacterium]|nr:UDP-N-acetylmuramate dehydrogenase [Flavobacteriaceae bacterium]
MLRADYSLLKFNTMHLDVSAQNFVSIESHDNLIQYITANDWQKPLYILGGGSNIVFLKDFEGTILHINIHGKEIVKEDENQVCVKANAGENWHEFVLWALQNDFGGLENLSLIPGKVGASPMQNIGAYGVEIKDVFEELEAVEISTGKIRKFNALDCAFGYRESVFKNELKDKFIITSVTFRLTKKNHKIKTEYGAIQQQLAEFHIENPTIQDVSRAVIAIRESKLPHPKEIPNCGSFFKNPTILNEKYHLLQQEFPGIPGYEVGNGFTKVPAGWLIEKAGWKGFRNETVGVHEKQALVLINHNHGSGQDIFDLSEMILQDIKQKFGIKLEREVNII